MAIAGQYEGGAGNTRARRRDRRNRISPEELAAKLNDALSEGNSPRERNRNWNESFIDQALDSAGNLGRMLEDRNDFFAEKVLNNIGHVGSDLERYAANRQRRESQNLPTGRPAPGFDSPGNRVSRRGGADKVDMLDTLMQTLMGSVQGTPPNMNYDEILQDQLDSINDAYDAQTKVVRRNNRKAKADTSEGRKEVEAMYAALSRQYNREAARQDQETGKDVHIAGGMYNRQARGAEHTTDRLQREQANLLDELGINAAGAETIPQMSGVLNRELSGIRQEKTHAKNRARERGNIQENWLNTQSGLATEEGYQRSADMIDALNDYLFQNRNTLIGIEGERQQSLGEAEAALATQLSEQQQDYQNAVWDRLTDVADFGLDVQQAQAGNRLARMGLNLDRQKAKADIRDTQFDNNLDLRQFLLDAQQSQEEAATGGVETDIDRVAEILSRGGNRNPQSMSVFNNLLGSTPVRRGFVMENGEKRDLTPEDARAIAINMGRRQNLSPTEMRLLQMAVLDYFK